MHALMNSFSLPAWFWFGLGGFLVLFIVKPAVRKESDAFLARLLGMKPKRTSRRDSEDEDDDE